MADFITIKGARTHNLKNINVDIPRDKLTVITGLSGSGKSSLAFDTIYAEGQRRYVESLSTYARQFLDRMDKPEVDVIEGLSPAVSVEQKTASHNPRSTVGTVTEIHDYLRLLFARIGKPFCYKCGRPIEKQTIADIVSRLFAGHTGDNVMILAPVAQQRKGEHTKIFERLRALGFVRVLVDEKLFDISEDIDLDAKKKHDILVVIDRIKISPENKSRVNESFESAFKIGEGVARIYFLSTTHKKTGSEVVSTHNSCIKCGVSYPKIEPQMFSFNSPVGACPNCDGLGELMYVDEDLVVPNDRLSINQGAIVPWFGKKTNYYQALLEAAAKRFKFSLDTSFNKLEDGVKRIIFDGSSEYLKIYTGRYSYDGFFEGVKNNLMRRYRETESDWMRGEIVKFMSYQPCPRCNGARLKPESLQVRIDNLNIHELTIRSLNNIHEFSSEIKVSKGMMEIAQPIIKEIQTRLQFLINVGLNYLTLDRMTHTLSSGEAQRIRLATQIGSALVGVTYVLDEPSIGLHQRDNHRLIEALKRLRDIGNTVIVVEHDEDAIHNADHIIDLGPRAGVHGGEVVYSGPFDGILKAPASITGEYLSHKKTIERAESPRTGNGHSIQLKGCRENNLKNINAEFPLGKFICITGVSGSGKSSLINDTLFPALLHRLYGTRARIGKHKELVGWEGIDKVINIDQSPIGRTPRSNPATYTGLFTDIRDLFSALPESKARGYKPGRFSFNVAGGRCETCEGDGLIRIEMHFLPDVFIRCETCDGKRFNDETLSIYFKGKNIADVLKMTVEEAAEFFKHIPPIKRKCDTLFKVGLGYIELGQAATTLSGGEAQRIKLSRELTRRSTGRTLYLLDEPTTGLHIDDVRMLLDVLNKLVNAGNTVIVIEHNMHVIKTADHIIDLGPEGGDAGGQIVAQGTPDEISKTANSFTGHFLKNIIEK